MMILRDEKKNAYDSKLLNNDVSTCVTEMNGDGLKLLYTELHPRSIKRGMGM